MVITSSPWPSASLYDYFQVTTILTQRATATPAQLERWADRLLEVESLEAVFNGG